MPVLDANRSPDTRATYERAQQSLRELRRSGDTPGDEELAAIFEDLVWVWEHGLEHRPSMVGVRSSFLLGVFSQLAEIYPPMLDYMSEHVRELESLVMAGEIDAPRFFDLSALNEKLAREPHTALMVRELATRQPGVYRKVAPRCWRVWMRIEDWDLFREHAPSPDKEMAHMLDLKERVYAHDKDPSPASRRERLAASDMFLTKSLDALSRAYWESGLNELAEEFDSLRERHGLASPHAQGSVTL